MIRRRLCYVKFMDYVWLGTHFKRSEDVTPVFQIYKCADILFTRERTIFKMLDNKHSNDVKVFLGDCLFVCLVCLGQHQVVSLINNFFSKEDLDYYTVPTGKDYYTDITARIRSIAKVMFTEFLSFC